MDGSILVTRFLFFLKKSFPEAGKAYAHRLGRKCDSDTGRRKIKFDVASLHDDGHVRVQFLCRILGVVS